MNKFDQVAANERVRYFGNVLIGDSSNGGGSDAENGHVGKLSLSAIREAYDGVVLAYGASRDRLLGIPGENGTASGRIGILSARLFVAWYNGMPEAQNLEPDLTSFDKVVIIGHGNVALDCARVLLTSPDALATTDITERALNALRASKIRHVEMAGRRGPLQVSFTTKELREMTKIDGLRILCDRGLITTECQSPAGKAYLDTSRPLKRMMDLLLKHSISEEGAEQQGAGAAKTFTLSFLRSPTEVLFDQQWGSYSSVPQLVRFRINRLEGAPASAKAVPTDSTVDIPCAMALRSIGYASIPLEGAPFDKRRNIIPNIAGRVVGEDGHVMPGLYVSGWVKRGPIGVIATTMQDAYRTADAVLMDVDNGYIAGDSGRASSRENIDRMLASEGVAGARVTNDDWKRLEAFEIAAGEPMGKPREKVTDVPKMLEIIRT
ncbi:NADPH-adrenodoxin reductase [Coemansia biformis]|uniref:NADPH:adrenodoxin oxidoreductase, mitochondrial n=1 Tax=Coemansia biformis TaxID=1286918 RepID=A0A9W7Y6I3_9FUNG|nr:NADPH-adrenodoxin reductase [Coemansia biformis]